MKKSIMAKIEHNYDNYCHYFGKQFSKGKLKSFSLKEKAQLDPTRQYWKLTNNEGETRYYELPKYIKANEEFNPRSLKRVVHNKAFIIPTSIVGTLALALAITSIIGAFNKPFVPDRPEPVPEDDGLLLEEFRECIAEGKDPVEEFDIWELAKIPLLKFIDEKHEYVTVGRGKTISSFIGDIEVTVRNAIIVNNLGAMEEAISSSSSPLAPVAGNRDYQDGNNVNKFRGETTGVETAKFPSTPTKIFTSGEYVDETGKEVSYPFLYTITKDTVLVGEAGDSRKPEPILDELGAIIGYNIHLELDTKYSVANHYIKRIEYIANHEIVLNHFDYINYDMRIDKDFNIIETKADEQYVVDKDIPIIGTQQVPTHATLTTRYYPENHNLIDLNTPFDYSNYQF